MSRQVNRSLEDKTMDQIDHALGRPVDPLSETFRNHFAVGTNSNTAHAFDASPYWRRNSKADGDMAFFHVTDEGRKALKRHLKDIGDKHRIFIMTFEGHPFEAAAESAAKARYSLWLHIRDARPTLSFKKFCQLATTRRPA